MVRRLCSVACLLILAVFTLSCAGNSPADEVQIDEPVPELPSDGDTRFDPGETGTAITEPVFGVAEVGNQGDTEPVDRSLEERIQINGAVARLDDPLWSVRRNAIGTLIDLDARETSEAVGRRLRDENAAVRQSAIDALRAFGAGEYTSDIADFLDSDIDSIRLATVRALSAFGARQHLERMRALENDPDDRVRFTVSQFLAKWDGYDERVAAWIQQLGDADPDVRRAVLGPIDLQNYPELAGNVAQLFSDPDPRTRTSAIAQFVSSRESREEFFDQIAQLFSDPDPAVRREAIAVLARFAQPVDREDQAQALSALLLLRLNDPSSVVRSEALRALGDLGVEGQAAAIAGSLADPDDVVRRIAGETLAELRSPVDTPTLFELLEPFVVRIDVEFKDGSGATGSGFFVGEDGSVMTNRHVVVGDAGATGGSPGPDWKLPKSIVVLTSDGERLSVLDSVWLHPELDLAVIRPRLVSGRTVSYVPIEPYLPDVGNRVIAIGHPFREEWSLTEGTVSQFREEIYGYDYFATTISKIAVWLQTDAAINMGNSGGPLFDLYGRLVGVVTWKRVTIDAEGQGYALSVRTLYSWRWWEEREHIVWNAR